MVITIPQIIAAVNPDLYYDSGEEELGKHKEKLKEFKALVKEKGILKAAEGAKATSLKINSSGKIDYKTGVKSEYTLTYESPTETLEPIYFFILDLMSDFGFSSEKMIDNFNSSPGSAHFGEMSQKATYAQQQGSKLMGDINTVLRSIINIVYDLREWKIKLQSYEDLNSNDKSLSNAARLSLKQVWMDKVDVQKGNSSIKAMAFGQAGFNTLVDAFLIVDDESLRGADGLELDLNDIVKRIVKSRIAEFNHWLKFSESELKKRFEIEKTYLKSQVNSLKLYSNWAKPYLKAAQELQTTDMGRNPSLVKMFNTMILELTLFSKRKAKGEFPASINYKPKRQFYEVILMDFNFRGMPQRTQQGYVSGGRATVTYRGYVLNDDEIKQIYEAFDKTDIHDAMNFIDGVAKESLDQLTEDIDFFLGDEKEEKKKEEKKRNKDTSNPFVALFGGYGGSNPFSGLFGKKSDDKKVSSFDLKMEKKYVIPFVGEAANKTTFQLFEIYKKAHGMPSFPYLIE